jgi:hypothetical protein
VSDGARLRRGGQARRGVAEDAVLSDEEVLRRVDLRGGDAPEDVVASPWIGEGSTPGSGTEPEAAAAGKPRRARGARRAVGASAAAAAAAGAAAMPPASDAFSDTAAMPVTPALETVRRTRASADDRRRQLWRDSATILIGVVIALLVGQTLIPANTAGPGASDTPLPSTVAIGSAAPPVSLPPGVTFGPIINPSLGVDASPTPIPVITMGPTPSPSPSPSPSIKPTTEPTPVPPVARFSGTVKLLTITFSNTSTGVIAGETTWLWSFGDGTSAKVKNPSHTYLKPGTYTVKLTMTTEVGTDSAQRTFTVVAPVVSIAPPPSDPPASDPPTIAPIESPDESSTP